MRKLTASNIDSLCFYSHQKLTRSRQNGRVWRAPTTSTSTRAPWFQIEHTKKPMVVSSVNNCHLVVAQIQISTINHMYSACMRTHTHTCTTSGCCHKQPKHTDRKVGLHAIRPGAYQKIQGTKPQSLGAVGGFLQLALGILVLIDSEVAAFLRCPKLWDAPQNLPFSPNSILLGVLNAFLRCPTWCLRLPEGLDSHSTPSWLPFLDGVSAFPRVLTPIVPLLDFPSWMVCPPFRGSSLPLYPSWLTFIPVLGWCPPSRGSWLPLYPFLTPLVNPFLDGVSAFLPSWGSWLSLFPFLDVLLKVLTTS